MNAVYIAIPIAVVLFVVVLSMGQRGSREVRKKIREDVVICKKLLGGDIHAKKEGIIRLDALLGKSLQYAGMKGETVGERLKNAKRLFQQGPYDAIWRAHKLRNTIVHEPYQPSPREFHDAQLSFESTIRRLTS